MLSHHSEPAQISGIAEQNDHPLAMRNFGTSISSANVMTDGIEGANLQNAVASFAYSRSTVGERNATDFIETGQSQHRRRSDVATGPGWETTLTPGLIDDREELGPNDDAEAEDETFSDPGYAESSATSYCSTLRGEAEDYYWEHGRRYHGWGGGRYLLPNDDQELNREDMKHHMWRLVLDGSLHLSPINDQPHKILDVGTGSGIWAMQAADAYPTAQVVGFDISPVQPRWVPPNLQFEVDDLEQEWLWKPNSFDFIHCRFMFMSVRDWPAMLQQAYRAIKPGGYVELSELALCPEPAVFGMPLPPTITKWFAVQGEALASQSFDMRIALKFKQLLTNAGFEAVVEDIRDVPWGRWSKDERMKMIGYWHIEQLKKGLHGIMAASLSRAGWTPMEIDIFIIKLKREMDDPGWMMQDKAYIVYGRKSLF